MPKGSPSHTLTFEDKIKMGLIKTPKEKLNSHFNYYYLFERLGAASQLPPFQKNK